MTEAKIFNPGNHREAWQRSLKGKKVHIVDDRGWEKQIQFDDADLPKVWVANGELLPVEPTAHEVFLERISDDLEFRPVEESGAVQPS